MDLSRSTPFRALVPLAVAILLAGCGGDGGGGDEYEAGLERVQAQLAEASDASQAAAGDVEDAQRREALAEAQQAMAKAAETADELDPPSDVRDAHEELADALGDYAELFGKIASTPPEDPSVSQLYGQAGEIVERLEQANRDIRDAGYAVPAAPEDGDDE